MQTYKKKENSSVLIVIRLIFQTHHLVREDYCSCSAKAIIVIDEYSCILSKLSITDQLLLTMTVRREITHSRVYISLSFFSIIYLPSSICARIHLWLWPSFINSQFQQEKRNEREIVIDRSMHHIKKNTVCLICICRFAMSLNNRIEDTATTSIDPSI